jgi:transmembrane sensor
VIVSEGEVLLDDGKNKLTVIAGHGAVYNVRDGFRVFKISERGHSPAPIRLQFTNASLSEVAGVIAEAFHVQIRVEPAVSSCALTADFTGEDLETILELIAETMQVKITKEEPEIVISGNGCL